MFYLGIYPERTLKISFILGLTYNSILNTFDMTEETRKSLEHGFGDLFESTKGVFNTYIDNRKCNNARS